MIGSLRGTIAELHGASVLLEIHGIGYDVRTSLPTLSVVARGEERLFYIHDHLREDAHDLYGFLTREELELFERLLGISGVGPKVALTILSAGKIDTVRRAILQGDLTFLTSTPGVGKKTAQKIILELKGQLVEEEGLKAGDGEVLEALVSLGYSVQQAREAVKVVSESVIDVAERVREALKYLAK